MAGKRPLKVFRTSAGFEDAYIAAPSQKAALEAWGAKRNLFAQGAAEVVSDTRLIEAALAHPGEVLRVPRGTTAQHLAASGDGSSPASGVGDRPADKPQHVAKQPVAPPKPRPSRAKLDQARAQIETLREAHKADELGLLGQIERLKEELAELKKEHAQDLASLQAKVEQEERAWRRALKAWEG